MADNYQRRGLHKPKLKILSNQPDHRKGQMKPATELPFIRVGFFLIVFSPKGSLFCSFVCEIFVSFKIFFLIFSFAFLYFLFLFSFLFCFFSPSLNVSFKSNVLLIFWCFLFYFFEFNSSPVVNLLLVSFGVGPYRIMFSIRPLK